MAKRLADLATLLRRRPSRRGRRLSAPPIPVGLLLDQPIIPDPRPEGAPATLDGSGTVRLEDLDHAIAAASDHLLLLQDGSQGYWVGELEANIALNAEYLLCLRYLGIEDAAKERRLVRSMRERQQPDGGWHLYDGAPSDLSVSIEAYFAAKLSGVSPDEPWMRRARDFVRAQGGAERARVLTRIFLALFGQFDWQGVPALPVTVMFMPRGTAFNIYEMSYWARTCTIPLLVLYYKKRQVTVPAALGIDELFLTPKEGREYRWDTAFVKTLSWRNFFLQADRALKVFERVPIRFHRERACKLAEDWILTHQDESGAWGGIFPAMTHSLMALHALGYPRSHPAIRKGLEALARLEITEADSTRLQPCVSPVWDTAWAVIALAKAGFRPDHPAQRRASEWLCKMQIRRAGDWAVKCPGVRPGGWAFQFSNDFYPDTDDTSVVLMALLHADDRTDPRVREAFDLGLEWLLGLQNDDGGFGAFERDVDNEIYNEILFNDAKNMLDPSTADVTGRCLELLGKIGAERAHPALDRAIRYLKKEQEPDGKWWGRWGVNYVYGTWSVLCALKAAGEPQDSPAVANGAAWLVRAQNPDGGWGESCKSYEGGEPGRGESSASQTAWAVMGLIAAGRGADEATRRGVAWLLARQRERGDGGWTEPSFTGTGFPGCFYLRYHYYRLYFPLLALARYREIAVAR